MNKHALVGRLRVILVGIALCGLLFYTILLPYFIEETFPGDRITLWIYLALLWLSAVPCYAVLVYGWRIVRNIGLDRSFTAENAGYLRHISTLAAADAAYILLIHLIFLLFGIGDAVFLLLSAVIVFIGIAVSTAAAALSHLVLRAAELQEQSDLTI